MLLLGTRFMGRCMSRRPSWPSGDIKVQTFGVFSSPGMKTRAKVAAEQMCLRATTVVRSLNSMKRVQGSERAKRHYDGRLGVRRTTAFATKKAQKAGAVMRVGPVLKLEKELRGRTIVVEIRLDVQSSQLDSCAPDTCRVEISSGGLNENRMGSTSMSTPGRDWEMETRTPPEAARGCDEISGPSNRGESGQEACVPGGQNQGSQDSDRQHVEEWAQSPQAAAASCFNELEAAQPADPTVGSASPADHSEAGAADAGGREPESSDHSQLPSCRSDGGQNENHNNSASGGEQQAESSARARVRRRLFDPPTADELETFFAEAESNLQRSFEQKYNFDLKREAPMQGRFEWTCLR